MSNLKENEFLTPVGRIVAGSVWDGNTTDFHGKPLEWKSGDKAGQPRTEWFIALAIPKTDAGFNDVWAQMNRIAKGAFPSMFNASGECLRPDFAWKYTDGDSATLNRNGVAPNTKEGYPGHWVLSLASSHPPRAYDRDGREIPADTKAIKRGDYVRIFGSMSGNSNQQNPGIYLNLSMIQFSHAGEEIFSGPDAATIFGGTAMPAAPAGVNTTPSPALHSMPTGSIPAAQTPVSAPASTPGVPPVSAPASAPGVVQGVTPSPDFLNGPAPSAPAPTAPAPAETFVCNGVAYSREALRASGWSDAQIDALPRG